MPAFDTVKYGPGKGRVKSKSSHLYASGDLGEPSTATPPKLLPNLNKKAPKNKANKKTPMTNPSEDNG